MSEGGTERPEWLPDEYDPDDSLEERVPIMAEIDGGIELHVKGQRGTVEIVGSPQHHNENPRHIRVCCGSAVDNWGWEIVVPKENPHNAYLEKVDPNQDVEAYEATKSTWLTGVDVRMYGVDAHRYVQTGSERGVSDDC